MYPISYDFKGKAVFLQTKRAYLQVHPGQLLVAIYDIKGSIFIQGPAHSLRRAHLFLAQGIDPVLRRQQNDIEYEKKKGYSKFLSGNILHVSLLVQEKRALFLQIR